MKKKILLVLILLLFSGCSVNYDIVINKNLTINEKMTIKYDNLNEFQIMKNFSENKPYEKNIIEMYNNLSENKNYKIIESKNSMIITNKRNLQELNNKYIEEYFSQLYSECNNEICKIIGIVNKDKDFSEEDYVLSIKLKNIVLESNESEIDLIKDTYIWYYNDEPKDLYLVFYKDKYNTINKSQFKKGALWFIIVVIAFGSGYFIYNTYRKFKEIHSNY